MLYQVDAALARCSVPAVPAGGWLKTVRRALGMSAKSAGGWAGVSNTAWADAERREEAGTISLGILRAMADALGCDVAYALVPRGTLAAAVESRAMDVAKVEADALRKTPRGGKKPDAAFLRMFEKTRARDLLSKSNWSTALWRK